jgi:hypothetical protein
MLPALLLLLLQDPKPSPVPAELAQPGREELAALSIRELAHLYPRPDRQRALPSQTDTAPWNPYAFEMHQRLEHGEVLGGDEWRELLVGKGYVFLRPRWPAGVPLTMRVERPWILSEGGIRMEPVPSFDERKELPRLATLHSDERGTMCGQGIEDRLWRERHKVLGLLPRGKWQFDFRTEVEQTIDDARGKRIPGPRLWSGVFGFDVEIVDDVDDAVPPDRDERWTQVLRAGLRIVASRPPDERRLAWLELELDRASWPSGLQSLFEVQLLCAGVPFGASRISDPDCPEPPEFRIRRSTLLEQLPWSIANGNESPEGWSVRIRGVRGDVLYDWDVTRWWAGSFEVPLADLIRR